MDNNLIIELLSNITILEDGSIKSEQTDNIYKLEEFIDIVGKKYKLTKTEKQALREKLVDRVTEQSKSSVLLEKIIDKYGIKYSDGIYIIDEKLYTIADMYKLFWKNERFTPDETDRIIDNIERVSEETELQYKLFEQIQRKAKKGKSEYLKSMDIIYPNNTFRELLHNILVPGTKPLFHILYDSGIGGTGKSTLLEVITKIVGESLVSNVLLDQFGNRFVFSNMLGKYVNIGDDNGKNDELENVGTLKSIVTGGRVTIDRKNLAPIEVRIFAKQIFATNILPYIDFTDGGLMRRLNIINMSTLIPKSEKLCEFTDEEIGHIVYEALEARDIVFNRNDEAIITSPLYRFYNDNILDRSYSKYKDYCYEYGFKPMNITNFEVKSKFIKNYIDINTPPFDIPFD